MIQFNPKYNIGDKVYHITPESREGIILDISYNVVTNQISYLISIEFDTQVWAIEMELSKSKVFK